MTIYVLTFLFCQTFDCSSPVAVRRYYTDQAEAVAALQARDPRTSPHLFKSDETDPKNPVVTELTVQQAKVTESAPGKVIPEDGKPQ